MKRYLARRLADDPTGSNLITLQSAARAIVRDLLHARTERQEQLARQRLDNLEEAIASFENCEA